MPAPLRLCVWFDADCRLCARIARWLERQPKFVPLDCVPAQAAAGAGCPLTAATLLERLTVTASDGAVYRGTNAWLVCLWALRRYRAWSLRLAHGPLRPVAEHLFATIVGLAALGKRRGS
jgi:predicted DCC family thiol-disulfide oxidoreductase YuxK